MGQGELQKPETCRIYEETLWFQSRERKSYIPCLSSVFNLEAWFALMTPYLESSFWGPKPEKDVDLLDWLQKRATKMIRGLEHLSCGDRLRDLECFSLRKRRLRGDLRAAFRNLKKAVERFLQGHVVIRGDGFKLREGRFRLHIITRCEGGKALE